jgi:hypothetical protein
VQSPESNATTTKKEDKGGGEEREEEQGGARRRREKKSEKEKKMKEKKSFYSKGITWLAYYVCLVCNSYCAKITMTHHLVIEASYRLKERNSEFSH